MQQQRIVDALMTNHNRAAVRGWSVCQSQMTEITWKDLH